MTSEEENEKKLKKKKKTYNRDALTQLQMQSLIQMAYARNYMAQNQTILYIPTTYDLRRIHICAIYSMCSFFAHSSPYIPLIVWIFGIDISIGAIECSGNDVDDRYSLFICIGNGKERKEEEKKLMVRWVNASKKLYLAAKPCSHIFIYNYIYI